MPAHPVEPNAPSNTRHTTSPSRSASGMGGRQDALQLVDHHARFFVAQMSIGSARTLEFCPLEADLENLFLAARCGGQHITSRANHQGPTGERHTSFYAHTVTKC